MNIKDKIKQYVEESLLIEEDKTSIIKKMNQLSRNEQMQLINLFKSKPHLEKKVKDYNIDWNRYKELKFEDFAPLFEQGSMGAEFKKLRNGKDYLKILDSDLENIPGFLGVFMPLDWNASNILTKKAGGTSARWCIGYDGDDGYWYCYSHGLRHREYGGDGEESVFFIIITTTDKWAVQVQTTNNNNIKIWDASDTNHGDDNDIVPMVDVRKLVKKHSRAIDDVHKEIIKRGENNSRLDDLKEGSVSIKPGDLISAEIYNANNDTVYVDIRVSNVNGDSVTGSWVEEVEIDDSEVLTLNGSEYTEIGLREEYPKIERGDSIEFNNKFLVRTDATVDSVSVEDDFYEQSASDIKVSYTTTTDIPVRDITDIDGVDEDNYLDDYDGEEDEEPSWEDWKDDNLSIGQEVTFDYNGEEYTGETVGYQSRGSIEVEFEIEEEVDESDVISVEGEFYTSYDDREKYEDVGMGDYIEFDPSNSNYDRTLEGQVSYINNGRYTLSVEIDNQEAELYDFDEIEVL
jgi:hypothetical protein